MAPWSCNISQILLLGGLEGWLLPGSSIPWLPGHLCRDFSPMKDLIAVCSHMVWLHYQMIYLCSEFLIKDQCPKELGMADKNTGGVIVDGLIDSSLQHQSTQKKITRTPTVYVYKYHTSLILSSLRQWSYVRWHITGCITWKRQVQWESWRTRVMMKLIDYPQRLSDIIDTTQIIQPHVVRSTTHLSIWIVQSWYVIRISSHIEAYLNKI